MGRIFWAKHRAKFSWTKTNPGFFVHLIEKWFMNARKEMKYWPHTWYRRHSWCKTIENKDKRTRDHGDGTVMMIGEGGTSCTCADDGIEVIKQPLLKQRRHMKLNTTLQMRLRLHLNRTMHIPWICRLVKLWSESITVNRPYKLVAGLYRKHLNPREVLLKTW